MWGYIELKCLFKANINPKKLLGSLILLYHKFQSYARRQKAVIFIVFNKKNH